MQAFFTYKPDTVVAGQGAYRLAALDFSEQDEKDGIVPGFIRPVYRRASQYT